MKDLINLLKIGEDEAIPLLNPYKSI